MQIAAQARNQRWHDFLCATRDELQARLRQQGYSERSSGERRLLHENDRLNAVQGVLGSSTPNETEAEEPSARWVVPAPEGDALRGVEDRTP
jgi:hypothetical protein